MSLPRFFCPFALAKGASITLPDAAAHHASRVLRLRQGDQVSLFNGEGMEYAGHISNICKQSVIVTIQQQSDVSREPPFAIQLAQGISTGEKMDFTLQKAIELGVGAIQPLAAARSVVKLKDERAEKRVQHWQQVVVSACEQCGRNVVPQVAPIATLPDWLAGQGAGAGNQGSKTLGLILSPLATQTLHDIPKPQGPITLLIGPEGGLTAEEISMARQRNFTEVRLGPRVLRTETAALATLAAMQALWGDF